MRSEDAEWLRCDGESASGGENVVELAHAHEAGLSLPAGSVWAKSSKEDGRSLPLWRHLADSAAVARRLWDEWLPVAVRRMIAEPLPAGDADGRLLTSWLAGVHDIGKATPAFAIKVPALAERVRRAGLPMPDAIPRQDQPLVMHATTGQLLLESWLADVYGWTSGQARQLTVVVGGHHGVPPTEHDLRTAGDHPAYLGLGDGQEAWRTVQRELLTWAANRCETTDRLARWREVRLPQPVQVLLTAVVIIADWIASNETLFPYNPSTFWTPSRLTDAWSALDLPTPWRAVMPPTPVTGLLTTRFRLPAGATPHPVQVEAVECARTMPTTGLLIIEAPMGEGKTEAALAAAEVLAARSDAGGVFVALPTRATSDAMFDRVMHWLERVPDADPDRGALSVMLAHGKARFHDDYGSLMSRGRSVAVDSDTGEGTVREIAAHHWLSGRKKALLSSFVVGTVDQLLFGALRSRHLALRHLGLAGKVVIIDEAHAYDVYMSQYLDRVLEWLAAYRVPTIVLSATLPARRRKELVEAYDRGRGVARTPPRGRRSWRAERSEPAADPNGMLDGDIGYPVLTATGADGKPSVTVTRPSGRTVEVELSRIDDDLSTLAAMLRLELSGGGCVLVVRNTVRRVQETADHLRAALPEIDVSVAHSRFLAPHRAANDQWLRKAFGPPSDSRSGDADPRPGTHVVVASQVAEQSLDIDFDLLVTDVAPVDLVLQRMGRLHRHARGEGQALRPPRLRRARCVVAGVDWSSIPPEPVTGSVRVYGRHALLRSLAVLQPYIDGEQALRMPAGIAPLVQSAYADGQIGPDEWQPAMTEARHAHERRQDRKKRQATTFRLAAVGADGEPILGWLNAGVGDADDDHTGRQQVRDTAAESVEVIVLVRRTDGALTLPSLLSRDGGPEVPVEQTPPSHVARAAASCTLALPVQLCNHQTIMQLERENYFPAWQESPWLAGEFVLVLDEDGAADLAGYRLHYHRQDGLRVSKAPAGGAISSVGYPSWYRDD